MLTAAVAQVKGSRLVLLREFLRNTAVEVNYSGSSVVQTTSGLPEGGMIGTLCYPLLPRLLDLMLDDAGAGIGVGIPAGAQESLSGLDALDPSHASQFAEADARSN